MKDLKSFLSKQKEKPAEKASETQNVQDTISKLSQKSETELYGELFDLAAKGKADGSLDESALRNFESTVAPYLTAEQQNKLQEILEKLRKV